MSIQLTQSEVIHGRINLKATMLANSPEEFRSFNEKKTTIANLKQLHRKTFTKELTARTCSQCGKGMNSGYYADGGYFCSDTCMNTVESLDELLEALNAPDDDSVYWTEWTAPKDRFHSMSLCVDLQAGLYKGSLYTYNIEEDLHNKCFELSICTTGLSELETGEELGIVNTYNYQERAEAEADIEYMMEITNIILQDM